MLILTQKEVESLLELDKLIDALATAMRDLSSGQVSAADRAGAIVPEQQALLLAMPAYVPSMRILESKLITNFPGNAGTDLPSHQAVIVAFNPGNGKPEAVIDGTYITAARTGACSALSARLLARDDASVLAILGTGVEARSHAHAVPRVRRVDEVRIAGRDEAKARNLAEQLRSEIDLPVRAVSSYAEAMAGADIVCATTNTREPVVRREWLGRGTHVTSIGNNPNGREVDDATIAEAVVVVESRQAVLAPLPHGANDLIQPIRDGLITADHIRAELGELVSGTKLGRASDDEITLYKSVGAATQDAAAVALVLEAARRRGVGHDLAL